MLLSMRGELSAGDWGKLSRRAPPQTQEAAVQLTRFGVSLVALAIAAPFRGSRLLDGAAREATVRRKFVAHRLFVAWLLAIVGLCGMAVTRTTSAASAQPSTPVGPAFAFYAIGGVQKLPWPECGRRSQRHTGRRPKLADTPRPRSQRAQISAKARSVMWPAPDQGRPARDESLSVPGTLQNQRCRSVPPQLSGMSSRRGHGRAAGNPLAARVPFRVPRWRWCARDCNSDRVSPPNQRLARKRIGRARTCSRGLHKGGLRMPPRDYLQDEDMRMLFAYLTHLADSRRGTPVDSRRQLGTARRTGRQGHVPRLSRRGRPTTQRNCASPRCRALARIIAEDKIHQRLRTHGTER